MAQVHVVVLNKDMTKVLLRHDSKRHTFDFIGEDNVDSMVNARVAAEEITKKVFGEDIDLSGMRFLQFEQCTLWDGSVWSDYTYAIVIPELIIEDTDKLHIEWKWVDDPHMSAFGNHENAMLKLRRSIEMLTHIK